MLVRERLRGGSSNGGKDGGGLVVLPHSCDRINQKRIAQHNDTCLQHNIKMFSLLLDIDLQTDYATPYETNRAAYLLDAEALKKATGPYKAARDAYVAATATFTKSLYE